MSILGKINKITKKMHGFSINCVNLKSVENKSPIIILNGQTYFTAIKHRTVQVEREGCVHIKPGYM